MRHLLLVGVLGMILCGCAVNPERLAKCSADENPVPALGLAASRVGTPSETALINIVKNDCGPMRPVNQF